MNYKQHYDALMARARSRKITGYRERHHVIPKCLGGSNASENIVHLTAEEHYVAHQLLVKLHPAVGALVTVTMLMGKKAKTNKAYGWLRRRNAVAMRGMKERNEKIRRSLLGNTRASGNKGKTRPPFSEEWRRNIGNAFRGKPSHMLGKKHTQETRAKMSISMKGRNQKGDANNSRKLSSDDVANIRRLFADGIQQKQIAHQFGLSNGGVSLIVNRLRWNY